MTEPVKHGQTPPKKLKPQSWQINMLKWSLIAHQLIRKTNTGSSSSTLLFFIVVGVETDLWIFSSEADVVHPGALCSKVLRDVDGEVLNVGKTSNSRHGERSREPLVKGKRQQKCKCTPGKPSYGLSVRSLDIILYKSMKRNWQSGGNFKDDGMM